MCCSLTNPEQPVTDLMSGKIIGSNLEMNVLKCLGRQQQGGGVISRDGITKEGLLAQTGSLEAAYCNLPKEDLYPYSDDTPLSLLRNFAFMHDSRSPTLLGPPKHYSVLQKTR